MCFSVFCGENGLWAITSKNILIVLLLLIAKSLHISWFFSSILCFLWLYYSVGSYLCICPFFVFFGCSGVVIILWDQRLRITPFFVRFYFFFIVMTILSSSHLPVFAWWKQIGRVVLWALSLSYVLWWSPNVEAARPFVLEWWDARRVIHHLSHTLSSSADTIPLAILNQKELRDYNCDLFAQEIINKFDVNAPSALVLYRKIFDALYPQVQTHIQSWSLLSPFSVPLSLSEQWSSPNNEVLEIISSLKIKKILYFFLPIELWIVDYYKKKQQLLYPVDKISRDIISDQVKAWPTLPMIFTGIGVDGENVYVLVWVTFVIA